MKEMESQTKTSLKLQAYQYLKTKILNCEYRPNEFLNEQKLCAEMVILPTAPLPISAIRFIFITSSVQNNN